MSSRTMESRRAPVMPIPRGDEWIMAATRLATALSITPQQMWAALEVTRTMVIDDPWRDQEAGRAAR